MPRAPLGARILTWIFYGFWGALALKTRGGSIPRIKLPPPNKREHRSIPFDSRFLTKIKQIEHFWVFLHFLYPPDALERRHWYSNLEQALAVNLVKCWSKTVVV